MGSRSCSGRLSCATVIHLALAVMIAISCAPTVVRASLRNVTWFGLADDLEISDFFVFNYNDDAALGIVFCGPFGVVLLQNESGSFNRLNLSTTPATRVVGGDINNDGSPEVVFVHQDGPPRIGVVSGENEFEADISFVSEISDVFLIDFDMDGFQDIIFYGAATQESGASPGFVIAMGSSSSDNPLIINADQDTFVPLVSPSVYDIPLIVDIRVDDLDFDNRNDLVVLGATGTGTHVVIVFAEYNSATKEFDHVSQYDVEDDPVSENDALLVQEMDDTKAHRVFVLNQIHQVVRIIRINDNFIESNDVRFGKSKPISILTSPRTMDLGSFTRSLRQQELLLGNADGLEIHHSSGSRTIPTIRVPERVQLFDISDDGISDVIGRFTTGLAWADGVQFAEPSECIASNGFYMPIDSISQSTVTLQDCQNRCEVEQFECNYWYWNVDTSLCTTANAAGTFSSDSSVSIIMCQNPPCSGCDGPTPSPTPVPSIATPATTRTASPTLIPTTLPQVPTPLTLPTIPISSPTTSPPHVTTLSPTPVTTNTPTLSPTPVTTNVPTLSPTSVTTDVPTLSPTSVTTNVPSPVTTRLPTPVTTDAPTLSPTPVTTNVPSPVTTDAPTLSPTPVTTNVPSPVTTNVPTLSPTSVTTNVPSPVTTRLPTLLPAPATTTVPTSSPTPLATLFPARIVSSSPTPAPTDGNVAGIAADAANENVGGISMSWWFAIGVAIFILLVCCWVCIARQRKARRRAEELDAQAIEESYDRRAEGASSVVGGEVLAMRAPSTSNNEEQKNDVSVVQSLMSSATDAYSVDSSISGAYSVDPSISKPHSIHKDKIEQENEGAKNDKSVVQSLMSSASAACSVDLSISKSHSIHMDEIEHENEEAKSDKSVVQSLGLSASAAYSMDPSISKSHSIYMDKIEQENEGAKNDESTVASAGYSMDPSISKSHSIHMDKIEQENEEAKNGESVVQSQVSSASDGYSMDPSISKSHSIHVDKIGQENQEAKNNESVVQSQVPSASAGYSVDPSVSAAHSGELSISKSQSIHVDEVDQKTED